MSRTTSYIDQATLEKYGQILGDIDWSLVKKMMKDLFYEKIYMANENAHKAREWRDTLEIKDADGQLHDVNDEYKSALVAVESNADTVTRLIERAQKLGWGDDNRAGSEDESIRLQELAKLRTKKVESDDCVTIEEY